MNKPHHSQILMAKDYVDSIWKGYTQEGLDMHAIKNKFKKKKYAENPKHMLSLVVSRKKIVTQCNEVMGTLYIYIYIIYMIRIGVLLVC